MELLRLDQKAVDVVKSFNEKNKLIAAICSGTMMLISADVIKIKGDRLLCLETRYYKCWW